MPFPLRRVLAGFAVGAAAGWFAGLLRTPGDAPVDSSADAATRLPQREFGALPGLSEPPMPPGTQEEPSATEPEDLGDPAPKAPEDPPPPTATPKKARAPRKSTAGSRRSAAVSDPTDAAAQALRAGHEAATERLVEPTVTPPPKPDPARRRVRRTPTASDSEA